MVRALVLSILIITALYLLVNWAYWTAWASPAWRSRRPSPPTCCAGLRHRRRGADRGAGRGRRADVDQRDDDRRRAHELRRRPRLAAAHSASAIGTSRAARRAAALLVQGIAALLLVGVGALRRRRLPGDGRVHRAGVLAVLPARGHRRCSCCASREPHSSARSGCRCTRCCRCCSARLRLHAVVEPVVRLQPGPRRPQRRLGRRGGARRRRRAAAGRAQLGARRPFRRHPFPSGALHEHRLA